MQLEALTADCDEETAPFGGRLFYHHEVEKGDTKRLHDLSRRVGPGKKIIYDPTTGKVRIEVDLLAGYYMALIHQKNSGRNYV